MTSLPEHRPMLRRLLGLAEGSYIGRDERDEAIARMHRRDAIGDRIHLVFACLGLLLIAGPQLISEIAFAPLAVFFFVRALNTAPLWIHGFGQPLMLATLALAAWQGITLIWSPDPMLGLTEIGSLRWVLAMPLIYPVIERRATLAGALGLGLIGASVAQLASPIIEWPQLFPFQHPGRIAGWWEPTVAGSIQLGAFGFFLPAAFLGRGRARWIGVIGVALAGAGVFASGTRGVWIGAPVVLVVGLVFVLRRSGPSANRMIWLVLAVLVLALTAGGIAMRDGLILRWNQANAEIRLALQGELDTNTGARIAMMRLGAQGGIEHPFGVGAGGTDAYAREHYPEDHTVANLGHAHSAPVHLLLTTGVPGLLLGGVAVLVMWRGASRAVPVDPARALEMGLPLAILGFALASVFDVVHLNAQSCAVLGAFAALSPADASELSRTSTDNRRG